MKKRWVLLASLLMGLLVLGACGSKKEAAASANHDLLQPGTIWKYSSLDKWKKIQVIDETTWEYSEDMNTDPVQMTVKRQKDYQGLEKYKIIDSAGAHLIIGKDALIIPYNKDGIKAVDFIPTSDHEKRTKQELIKEYSTKNGYKLQKTEE